MCARCVGCRAHTRTHHDVVKVLEQMGRVGVDALELASADEGSLWQLVVAREHSARPACERSQVGHAQKPHGGVL